MLNEEWRREISQILHWDGRVQVKDLAKRFRTSLITIRKDLELLHRASQFESTHRGARPLKIGAMKDRTLGEKEPLHRQEKLPRAVAAAQIIAQGQVLILDSGTTMIARACCHFKSLTPLVVMQGFFCERSDQGERVLAQHPSSQNQEGQCRFVFPRRGRI
jgi:DeoR/GlpR family transcriptional regulator of sugar metabolism